VAAEWAWTGLVAACGLAVVAGSALLHFAGLDRLDRWCFCGVSDPGARAALVASLGVIVLHLVQIAAFGALMWWVTSWPGGGMIDADGATLLEAIYLSALNYSTLGMAGDLAPTGAIRMLVAVESVFGLLAITWSASFTYHRLSRRLPGSD
jgi:hypothetical protein